MEDVSEISRNPRKRKSSREESNERPSPKSEARRQRAKRVRTRSKRKKAKCHLAQHRLVPSLSHLFRICGALKPLKISDIQDLILFAALHEKERHLTLPKWCNQTEKNSIQKVVIVLVSGIGAAEYAKNQDSFTQCNALFDHCVETNSSGTDFCVKLPHERLLTVNIPKKQLEDAIKKQALAPQNGNKVFQREDYILSMDQMMENDYPLLPEPSSDQDSKIFEDDGYLSTKSHNGLMTLTEPPMYAIDCEMCETAEGMELTRISVVDESFNVLYDTLVKPSNQIIDYKTKYSGITEDMLKNVTTTLANVQKRLINLFPSDAILLGHSLENDLRALKLYHQRVIDTSVIYPANTSSPFFKASLRGLAHKYLDKDIQNGKNGHCSVEDASACMELVQLKIENGPDFGAPPVEKEGLFERTSRNGKIVAMLDYSGILRKFCTGATHTVSCSSDEEIVSNAVQLMQGSEILWAHLHEAEMFLKENESTVDEEKEKRWKDVLQSVDNRIKEIHDAVPSQSLLLVLFGCGDLSPVRRLQRQREGNRTELKEAVKTAKKGVCFIKMTPEEITVGKEMTTLGQHSANKIIL
ncbi:uncharacterized protein [Acropora muricata]|uniref:uncharacterized protein isoform X2 n=1 Tax=Acropora muricata TaxID=159855 RepID=UPI0034E3F7EE